MPDGSRRPCEASFCKGGPRAVKQVAIDDRTGEVVIVYDPDFSSRPLIYGWNPVSGRQRIIRQAAGELDAGAGYGAAPCPRVGSYLICVSADADRPPRLVRVDMKDGSQTTLFDPNQALAAKAFGKVEYLSWTDDKGWPAHGVLVLPEGEAKGLPLVITTTSCRGFLRGGSLPLVPEHMLTQMGIAALCVNSNNATQLVRDAQGREIPLAVHKATVRSMAAIIDKLAKRGVIDRRRVGVSGHSFGSMVSTHALSHTDLFAAAAIGTGGVTDPAVWFLSAPTADSWRKVAFTGVGLPPPGNDPEGIWAAESPALNAKRIKAPLLLLPPGNEWMMGLPLFTAIEDAGGTADFYIFPDEGHMVGRQPIHQYWRNRRSLDWFGFWLTGRDEGTAETAEQFAHWKELRRRRERRPE